MVKVGSLSSQIFHCQGTLPIWWVPQCIQSYIPNLDRKEVSFCHVMKQINETVESHTMKVIQIDHLALNFGAQIVKEVVSM